MCTCTMKCIVHWPSLQCKFKNNFWGFRGHTMGCGVVGNCITLTQDKLAPGFAKLRVNATNGNRMRHYCFTWGSKSQGWAVCSRKSVLGMYSVQMKQLYVPYSVHDICTCTNHMEFVVNCLTRQHSSNHNSKTVGAPTLNFSENVPDIISYQR